jgi:hypothetical protein
MDGVDVDAERLRPPWGAGNLVPAETAQIPRGGPHRLRLTRAQEYAKALSLRALVLRHAVLNVTQLRSIVGEHACCALHAFEMREDLQTAGALLVDGLPKDPVASIALAEALHAVEATTDDYYRTPPARGVQSYGAHRWRPATRAPLRPLPPPSTTAHSPVGTPAPTLPPNRRVRSTLSSVLRRGPQVAKRPRGAR